MGRSVPQLVETLCHRVGGSGYDSWDGPYKFSSDLFFLSVFSNPESTPPLTEVGAAEFL